MGSMAGSYRVVGGLGRVTQRLAERLPPASLSLGTTLKSVSMGEGDAAVQGEVLGPGGVRSVIVAKAVVIAAPPQLVEATVTFEPKLPAAAISRMKQIPTWMAGWCPMALLLASRFPQWTHPSQVSHGGDSGKCFCQGGKRVERSSMGRFHSVPMPCNITHEDESMVVVIVV